MDQFEQFTADVEKVRAQLFEGAITFNEYFNAVAQRVIDLTNTHEYQAHLISQGYTPEAIRVVQS